MNYKYKIIKHEKDGTSLYSLKKRVTFLLLFTFWVTVESNLETKQEAISLIP